MFPLIAANVSSFPQGMTSSTQGAISSSISLSNRSLSKGDLLLRIPAEIRCMIYAFLFSAGDLSMLHVCKEINMEAQSILYQAGVFRKEIGYRTVYRFHHTSLSPLAQNFELRCNLDSGLRARPPVYRPSNYTFDMMFAPASYYDRGDICRKQMLMKLDFGPKHHLSKPRDEITMLLAEPERFVGFRSLVVTFMLKGAENPRAELWTTADETMIRQRVKDILEPTLGPASEYEEDYYQCVEFRPWTFAKHQHRQRESLWTTRDALGRQRLYKRFYAAKRSIDGSEDGRTSSEGEA